MISHGLARQDCMAKSFPPLCRGFAWIAIQRILYTRTVNLHHVIESVFVRFSSLGDGQRIHGNKTLKGSHPIVTSGESRQRFSFCSDAIASARSPRMPFVTMHQQLCTSKIPKSPCLPTPHTHRMNCALRSDPTITSTCLVRTLSPYIIITQMRVQT